MTLLKKSMWVICCIWLGSCDLMHTGPPERKVECFQPAEFDYLEYFEQWALDPCSTALCSTYTQIWKGLFMEQNGFYTETMFNKQIKVTGGNILPGGDGDFIQIEYKVQNDWAVAYTGDRFVIRLHTGHDFPRIGLPEEEYLSAQQIRKLLNNKGFDCRISVVPRTGPLKFSSRDEAIQALVEESGVDTLCFNRIFVSVQTGTLTLEAFAHYRDAENECIKGTVDLVTGTIQFTDRDCDRIFGY